ncbi:MAG: nucleotidyltransferase family protein [Steroidobacteraceae bacterium]
MMREWRSVLLAPGATVGDAIARIDASAHQIALVVDPHDRLLGVMTDGDVRRAILRGMSMSSPIDEVMNRTPLTAPQGTSDKQLLALMRRHVVHQMPLVNESNQVVGLALIDDLIGAREKANWVVLMAGGLGTRLRPLTEQTPKPMLALSGKPILESILENLVAEGFRRIFMSVNYKADMIEEYFGDGGRWGANISYLREGQRLGTAGSLSLMPEAPTLPIVVMNGDLLTHASIANLLDFHVALNSVATMAVREYDLQVPYGVVHIAGERITSIEEKPVQKFLVNAGIYVLSPSALSHVPPRVYFDMPTLFDRLNAAGATTVAFPLREFWLDIGRPEDYDQANIRGK